MPLSTILVRYLPPATSPVFARATNYNVDETIMQRALQKAFLHQRLNTAEALALFHFPDVNILGAIASSINEKKNHKNVFYNINRHINPSNVCSMRCKFCAFAKDENEVLAFTLSLSDIAERAKEAQAQGATEIHVTAGLHPYWNFEHYKNIIQTIKNNAPGATIKAFTATEIAWLAKQNNTTVQHVIVELQKSGLESLTGGGAEIFAPEIRNIIAPDKITATEWLDIHKSAHILGIKTTATMLYGHIEDYEARVNHLMELRNLQDITNGFLAFVPLKYQAWQKNKEAVMQVNHSVSAQEDLRTIAMARIILDNFSNIKAYWVMLSKDVAQVSLSFGANDLDGTVTEEHIASMANKQKNQGLTKADLIRFIQDAGYNPIERTTHYTPIRREQL